MTPEDFARKAALIAETEPDTTDIAMLKQAKKENDGSTVDLDEYTSTLDIFSGKLSLRIPRELHRELTEAAKTNGVSLNQYITYKLARN